MSKETKSEARGPDAPGAGKSAPKLFEKGGLLDPEDRCSGLPELLRRVAALGFSGLFTTEAAIRGALGDTVPREWVDFLSEQSERTRHELVDRLAEEFGRVLGDVDLAKLTEQLLAGRTIEVKAEIRLGPRDDDADLEAGRHRGAAPASGAPASRTQKSGRRKKAPTGETRER